MDTSHRPISPGPRLAWLAAAAALACSTSVPAPIACDSSAACPPESRCVQRACTANAPPLAVVAPLGAIEANALVQLDGSRSSDPDAPYDSVASYAWSARAVDAPCEPPVIAGTTDRPQVRFSCPGRYELALVVADELAAESAPALELVEVIPRAGPSLVTAGEDVAAGHRCEGEPLACRPVTELDGAIALSAVSAVEGVAFRWSVEPPPGLALDETRRVVFEPGPDVAEPLARLETDGTAISGDWIFRVEARDAAGVLGSAATRLSVGNSPPVVVEKLPVFHHAFSATSSRFAVDAAIPVTVTDPDGDPIAARSVSGHHAGDGEATFDVQDLGDRVAVRIELPYAQPEDAAFLIGGEGLERAISFAVRDVNGAEVLETWPVVVANRPPTLDADVATRTVNHSYDAAAGEYRATATLSGFSDPDGDPLVQAEPTGDAACPSFSLDASGRARFPCSLPSPVAAVAGNFVGTHQLHQRVRDPWAASPASVSQLVIGNRPPVVSASSVSVLAGCEETAICCDAECLDGKFDVSPAAAQAAGFVTDPDGDPLAVTVTPGGTSVCLPSLCVVNVSFEAELTCTPTRHRTFTVSATDGAATGTGTFLATRLCSL